MQGASTQEISVESALDIACENAKEAVLAVDADVKSEETINAAIQNRIGLIIESGDTEISNKTVKLADKYNIVLIKTGIKNNRY